MSRRRSQPPQARWVLGVGVPWYQRAGVILLLRVFVAGFGAGEVAALLVGWSTLGAAAGRWLRLHAARLTQAGALGTGQTAVILESAGPAELSPLLLDLHGLTDRERQITQLVLRGLPTAEIAWALFISRYTLSDHMKAIFAKLGVSSRPELTALLLDCGPGHPVTRAERPRC